ncbi:MAG: hypothetical protein HQK65_10085 [Desulfamplus sp.]|nr:hypothetical protein [Desulfamplus sp.]
MIKKTALEKRVKRRITARTHRFFAVCSPGLKRLCHREILALAHKNNPDDSTLLQGNESIITDINHQGLLPLTFQDITIIQGGVEFTGSVQDCYTANLYLRSPSRILMRIAKFKAENFRVFEKKLGEIEWELYLRPEISVKYEVSTISSRLYHSDAIAQRAQKIVEAHFQHQDSNSLGFNANQEMAEDKDIHGVSTVMIRGEDDLFEISIDSSGELLHKRGLKEYVGAAPIRETLAFAILSAMGYTGDLPLIDGMCGSGTFALEAAMISRNIPAGFFRKFAFENWPCFSIGQWYHMKKIAEANIRYQCQKSEYIENSCKDAKFQKPSIFAVDRDSSILELLSRTVNEFNLSSYIKIIKSDFLEIDPEGLTVKCRTLVRENKNVKSDYEGIVSNSCDNGNMSGKKGFLVLNPPYGKRIGDKNNINQIFADIGRKLKSDFRGWCAAVIIPDKRLLDHLPGTKSLIPLFHGGLEIHAAIILL